MVAEHQQKAFQSWMKFLNPESLKSNLINASLFLAAYESLRSSVMEQLKDFFLVGFDQAGNAYSPEYQSKVLSRDKSPLRASLLWLKDMNVVTDADLELVDRLREHRNELAHDLPRFIAESDSNVNVLLLAELHGLVARIDLWWIREVEVPCNPDFTQDDVESIDYENVMSGRMLFLQTMLEIATGNSESASALYDGVKNAASELLRNRDRS